MPLVRVEVRNVYGLGKTELHRDVDREDPKAVLNGVAVSGLVGILRQLGDLTEFATEIFHGIQEEVILTSSRSNKLKMRLKQIETTVPSIQKAVLEQPNHIQFAYTGGLEWHPRIPNVQDYFVYDDLPQFIMAPYDDCRDPPRLQLLDKFDINGPGSCLKRYTDPTHFKRSSRASKHPVIKKKKSLPRSRDVSRVASMANQSDRKTLTSLSFSGRTSSSKTASTVETESKSDLQDHRSCSFDSRSGGEKLKGVYTPSRFTPGPRTIASVLSESESESEDATDDSPSQDLTPRGSSCVSWREKAEIVEADTLKLETDEAPEVMETNAELESGLKEHRVVETVQDITPRVVEMDSEDETESEEDDFVDALYTIDSESDNDQEVQKQISNEITEEEFDNYVCEKETENVSNSFGLEDEAMCAAASELHLSSPVSKPDEMIHQDPWEDLDMSNGTTHSYSNGFSNPLYDTNGVQEHQESEDESSCDNEEGTQLWTNGNLLGLKPSKPEIEEETIKETDAEALQEQPLREAHKADFDWFTSSPQLDHMKISFTPSETLPSSELKLKLPDEYTFSSFQLVPETGGGTSLPDSDSDKDTFCRTSSYVSDNSDNQSVSISEQQSDDERKSQQELYDDSFHRINTEASSLSAPSSQFETSNGYLAGKISYLQNPAEPLPPPLPPLQWMVSKVPSGRFEDNNKQSFKDTLTRALEQRSSLSTVKKEESNNVTAYDPKPDNNKQSFKETLTRALEQRSYLSTVKKEEPNNIITYDPKPDNNKQSFKDTLTRALEQRSSLSMIKKEESNSVIAYDTKPENNVRDYKQSHGNVKETEAGDFLHQIRTKQFTLRRVVTTKASSSEATMNTNFSVILEKANSIRQAVANDDGDGESDTWSDSDT
ncbi:protein SCAR1 [Brassica rapa]|uniref:Protein SCAR n=2 Tax=Brassica TaxID=3705 RepID=A0ABQ8D7W2_BRANA|nr:protein SCAR1 [Brassica rapa]XP_022574972.2 protein SCAR1 [Brassica napus]KAH0925444.1 hypothetical protein HID58_017700 [Brassica napus]